MPPALPALQYLKSNQDTSLHCSLALPQVSLCPAASDTGQSTWNLRRCGTQIFLTPSRSYTLDLTVRLSSFFRRHSQILSQSTHPLPCNYFIPLPPHIHSGLHLVDGVPCGGQPSRDRCQESYSEECRYIFSSNHSAYSYFYVSNLNTTSALARQTEENSEQQRTAKRLAGTCSELEVCFFDSLIQ